MVSRISYSNNKINGLKEEWYSTGKPKLKINYEEGKQHGKHESWYKNGKPETLGHYDKGLKSGLFKTWLESGILKAEMSYVKISQQGEGIKKEKKETDKDQPKTSKVRITGKNKGRYVSLAHGKATLYYDNGKKFRESTYYYGYKNGKELSGFHHAHIIYAKAYI